ncbi:TetR/AcrR family transcriptional regulator [Nocardia gamkensis]|uniref:TetR/AcrR family transcriptional regulator n=1 Tax=Nocardia gamkensis TaxID=352869 RepID=A0A7X6L120_9NOCA|nr:TetR/AcrR family transcriptional regulator [Nocardia gamkensis]NKY25904.1 TetR/AcrR family transcriptional regulator [Nocardia gamkensis]NQE68899.1 putative HTH-type transcriptional regulator [Nocardia gamkensis]
MATNARSRLIESAIELLRRRGVAGTGVAELLEHSGTARQSIYKHFPGGKTELIEESVRTAAAWIEQMIEQMADTLSPPEMLQAFVEYWKWVLVTSDYQSGCPIAAAAYGGSEAPGARELSSQAFRRWEHHLSEQAIARGVPTRTAHSLATTTIAAIEGAVMMSIADRSIAPLNRTYDQLRELLLIHLEAP